MPHLNHPWARGSPKHVPNIKGNISECQSANEPKVVIRLDSGPRAANPLPHGQCWTKKCCNPEKVEMKA
jgi:hypothetical protein